MKKKEIKKDSNNKKTTIIKKKKQLTVETIDEKKLEKIDEEIKKNKIKKKNKARNEKSAKRKKIITNVLVLAFSLIYILLLVIGTKNIPGQELIIDLKVFSYFFLTVAIIIFEITFKKDNFEYSLFGIESLYIAGSTLYMLELYTKHSENIVNYFTYIVGAILLYYLLKIIVILLKKKKK